LVPGGSPPKFRRAEADKILSQSFMQFIDKAEYEKRLARLSGILTDMVHHAAEQILTRCPYKDAKDRCTAQFGCRNQRNTGGSALPHCAGDDKLDYRSAWETDAQAYEDVARELRASAKRMGHEQPVPAATVRCGEHVCTSVKGQTLFDHADRLGVKVPTSCGRTGQCHECIVEVRRGGGALGAPAEAEGFLGDGYRLACQARVEDSLKNVEFALLRRSPKILTSQTRRAVALDPAVTHDGQQVYYDGTAIDQYRGRIYGIALDVGTTTVVLELVDLETGQSLYETAFENPQRFGGSDVMHRISYDAGPWRGELHGAIINTVNGEILEMCSRLGISRHEIYEIVVVGNATIRDLFFGLDVQSIGQKPYKSTIEHEHRAGKRESTALLVRARGLGLRANKNARVFGVPLVASHVGADVAADLVAVDIESQDDVVMLVDVGTNTEVVVGNKDRLVAASCPAGPAFEGGLVKFGMPGCEGAIESLRYVNGRFEYETIGGGEPIGICGSGLIDLLAELRRHQLMTPKGVFAEKAKEYAIVPEKGITFSRQDASHLAQAKAANYCGQWIVLREFGITPERIRRLYLAGGFANYVDPASAIEIGFLAPVPADGIVKLGNAAAQGARELLLSRSKRRSVKETVRKVEHVELETTPDFFDVFVEGCQFKPMHSPRAC
jgi:uncharacterized 2Fe-2S/4Fe-4S cluster protein (DUF4445 family)